MSGPGFLTGGVAAGGILALATLGAAALGWAEWRRPDRRRRASRICATLAAVGALALLALRPAMPRNVAPPKHPGPAALWTGGPRPADEAEVLRLVPPGRRFRLPGADAPEGTATVPDAGSLGRHVPDLGAVHLLGDGLDAGSLGSLTDSPVTFHPGPDGPAPRFTAAHANRSLGPGEPFSVAGRVRGGGTEPGLKVVLEGPDPAAAATVPVASDGTFRLRLPGFPAPGRFGWKLRLVGAGERVLEEEPGGVSVIASDPPRVLVLESSPNPDTAALRQWLGAAGGLVTVRTEVGRGRFRFTGTGAAQEFTALDAALLGRFDLVIADTLALATIPAPERGELQRAVTGRGLGLLIRGAPPAGSVNELPPPDQAFFLPWRIDPTGEPDAAGSETNRPSRLRWTDRAGEETAPEEPVLVPAARITPDGVEGAVVLVADGAGRAVSARVGRGRGRVGVTLVEDTARWRRAGQPGAFAAFWSALLGELSAVGSPDPAGRWTLAGEAASGPAAARVDGPVELRWQGPDGVAVPPVGVVTAEELAEGEPATSLPLARDLAEATRGTARFWPRHAGWHRVRSLPEGPPLDFYVAPVDTWAGVRARSRREATGRFMSRSDSGRDSGQTAVHGGGAPVVSGVLAGVFFLVFVAATGFLWGERGRVSAGN